MNKKSIAATTIIGGVLIFGIKIYSWNVSGSVALLSDALESIVNILASIMMFVSVLISGTLPDNQHRYGHQKIENMSCFMEGLLIIGAGLMICYMAYGRFFNPVELESLNFAVLISLLATVLNGFLS